MIRPILTVARTETITGPRAYTRERHGTPADPQRPRRAYIPYARSGNLLQYASILEQVSG